MAIGEKIRELRKEAKLSQQQLAARAHVSQATISNIETGIAKEPAAVHVWNIAKALNKSMRYIMTGEGEPGHGLPEDPDEAHVVAIYRLLNPANKRAWVASGRSYVDSQITDSAQDQICPLYRASSRRK